MLRAWSFSFVLVLGCGFPAMPGEDTSSTGEPGTEDGPPTPTATSTTTGLPTTTTTATSTVSTVTDTTVGDPDSSDEGSFIVEPEIGSVCLSCCDTWAQDCPEGEKCSAWANDGSDDWNGTRCSEIDANPGQPGDACSVEGHQASGLDTCDLWAMCWNVDPVTLEGTCVALCSGDQANPSCDDPDTSCFANDGVLNLCLPHCDPLASGCAADQACLPADDDFVCVTTVSGVGAAVGEPCEQVYDCQPDLTCLAPDDVSAACDPGADGCCTAYCDLSAPDPSAACSDPSQECVPWGAPPPYENVGACLLPGA